ncbi:cupin [Rhizobium sp. KVB221]|uniref:Cupin n=1 Tax=Rhizobium setariae TaxID=2801340 RepID=A0A937CR53_9HYPH|nr:cupin [Rhizobium setariae]MBL0375399.1 cupin [Rhizobium setariae]
MPIQKEHKEFHAVEMDGDGWHSPPGYPEEIEQKILAGSLDEINKTGNRTRLLRFRPGAYTTKPFVHDYWEEVYLISGDLIVGDANPAERISSFAPNTYACRPPGIYHGPFKSETGCLLLELHYYEQSAP